MKLGPGCIRRDVDHSFSIFYFKVNNVMSLFHSVYFLNETVYTFTAIVFNCFIQYICIFNVLNVMEFVAHIHLTDLLSCMKLAPGKWWL